MLMSARAKGLLLTVLTCLISETKRNKIFLKEPPLLCENKIKGITEFTYRNSEGFHQLAFWL